MGKWIHPPGSMSISIAIVERGGFVLTYSEKGMASINSAALENSRYLTMLALFVTFLMTRSSPQAKPAKGDPSRLV